MYRPENLIFKEGFLIEGVRAKGIRCMKTKTHLCRFYFMREKDV